MDKKVISRYEVWVYDNGELEIHPLVEEGDLKNCSSSMRQILSIIEFVLDYKTQNPKRHIHFAITTAVNHVANVERVTPATVHSKILRKLGISMQDFKNQLETCLENGAPEDDVFVNNLYGSCVRRTKQADEAGVNRIVKKMRDFKK